MRLAGEVSGHDGHGPSVETEGTGGHALVLDREQRLDARAFDGEEEIQWSRVAGGEIERGVRLACDLAAGIQAEGAAFVVSERDGQERGGLGHRREFAGGCLTES